MLGVRSQGWTGPPGYREIPGGPATAKQIFFKFYYILPFFLKQNKLAAANIGNPSGPKFVWPIDASSFPRSR